MAGMSPVDLFKKIYDNNIISFISTKKDHNFMVTNNQIETFQRFVLFTEYHQLPKKNYWSKAADLSTLLAKNYVRDYEIIFSFVKERNSSQKWHNF